MKKIVNGVLILVSLSMALVAVEAVFRLADIPETIPEKQYINFFQSLRKFPHPFYPDYHGQLIAYYYYTYLPGALWATEYPNNPRGYFDDDNRIYYQCNSDGFRDREFTPKAPGVFRVVAIGDSYTMGEGVRAEDTFSSRLESGLVARGIKAEVYNLGINGHGVRDETVTLAKALKTLQPDLVVWGYVLNDISHVMFDRWVIKTNKEKPWFIKNHTPLRFVNYLQSRLWSRYVSRSYIDFVKNMYEQKDYVRDLNRLFENVQQTIRQAGSDILVLIFPNLDALQKRDYAFAPIHEQLSDMFERIGLPAFDLSGLFKEQGPAGLKVHPSDRHPNEKAHTLATDRILNWMDQQAYFDK